ncbi:hypothetical protein L1987_18877 [Smallanthus sonchifolius]|uniref:Uncharacterized protein n=1 Tax=Smallanthus sonchifolius TaxID=185202 RepID=A0ACB9J3J2_9ASTR|nr:hypothetical protein L1987_18877 [Smallanthus sonchifolius]
MSEAYKLKNLCLRDTDVIDDCLFNFCGSSLEVLDVSNTKVSAAAVAHVIGQNPGLKCLKARGCKNLLQQGSMTESKNVYFELGKLCKLDEISVGWGFSYLSLEALKPAISLLKAIEVGLGGFLCHDGLKLLPVTCPLLESVVLYFQVISDDIIVNMLESLRHLKSFVLCHCLGETSSWSFKISMPNLRKLRLERVAPWMSNADLISLSQNCANLIELLLLGCRLLNSGEFMGRGFWDSEIFIGDAATKLPMLLKLSLDICDAKARDFDIPEAKVQLVTGTCVYIHVSIFDVLFVFMNMPQSDDDRHFLNHVKIARCKSRRCTLNLQHVGASRSSVHRETLILTWDSKQMIRTLVKERV